MIKGGTGGANTQSGLSFEAIVDLSVFLNKQSGYQVVGQDVFYNEQPIAKILKKMSCINFCLLEELIGEMLYLVNFFQIILFLYLILIQFL